MSCRLPWKRWTDQLARANGNLRRLQVARGLRVAHGLHITHHRELHLFRKLFWLLVVGAIVLGSWLAYRYYTTGELPELVAVQR